MPPSPVVAAERQDRKLWIEALERLEWPLRVKGHRRLISIIGKMSLTSDLMFS